MQHPIPGGTGAAEISRRAHLVSLVALVVAACKREKPLPKLGTLPDFALENQAGQKLTKASFAGQVWVASFMFTRCPTVCPRIMRRVRRLQDLSESKQIDLRFVSISVDPEFDTPRVLTEFAKRYGADFSRWSFATGNTEMVQKTIVQGFKVGLEGSIDPNQEHLGVTHGSHLVLVDQLAQIRGYYRSSEESAAQRLLLDASSLM